MARSRPGDRPPRSGASGSPGASGTSRASDGRAPGGPGPRDRVPLPPWSWAYVAFRLGDGASSALIPLAVVLHYELPLWALALTTAVMNLASVPATFLWASLVDRGVARRPLVVGGFAVSAGAMALLATLPPFPLFVLGGVLYTVFGVATSPAASTMVLQGIDRRRWSLATSSLSRRTGFSFLTGMVVSVLLGLAGVLDIGAMFAATATSSAMAALIAWSTVATSRLPHEPGFDPAVVRAGARLFERTVWMPGRLRHPPSLRGVARALRDPARLWPLGYAVTFMGSVSFFTSFPGVLANELGIAAGLVLLAQAPSHIVTPIAYPWAARHGLRVGESHAILRGSWLRTAAVPLMCGLIVLVGDTSLPLLLPALLVLHALMGLSFSLIQVNGPVLLAHLHPGGRGQGVGTYHAAVGAGTLLGALVAFVLLRLFPYPVSYVFSVGMTLLGCLLLWTAHRRWTQAQVDGDAATTKQG